MYKKVDAQKDVYELYASKLIEQNVITPSIKKEMELNFLTKLNEALDFSRT